MSKAFIEKILTRIQSVKNIEWQGVNLCRVERDRRASILTGFIWEHQIHKKDVDFFVDRNPDFIASIPSGAFWLGDAIQACEGSNIGWGGVGTLHSACLSDNPRSLSEKSTAFARRFMRQNRNVESVIYINSVLLQATLNSGKAVKIALCDAYDLTSEHVRVAWDEIGPFDAIFKNNPNGGISSDALHAATDLEISVIDKDTANQYFRASQ